MDVVFPGKIVQMNVRLVGARPVSLWSKFSKCGIEHSLFIMYERDSGRRGRQVSEG